MNIYNENLERINTEAICSALDEEQEAQQIDSGQYFNFVYDLLGPYGKFENLMNPY